MEVRGWCTWVCGVWGWLTAVWAGDGALPANEVGLRSYLLPPVPSVLSVHQGHYELYSRDAAGRWTKSFLVKIGPFALRADV